MGDDTHSGSIPLAAETVMDKGLEADFWLVRYNQPHEKTLHELQTDYAPYANFRAFREKRVYGCNTGVKPYYEEVPYHPEYLLEDYVRLFHPGLLPDGECRYYHQLAE